MGDDKLRIFARQVRPTCCYRPGSPLWDNLLREELPVPPGPSRSGTPRRVGIRFRTWLHRAGGGCRSKRITTVQTSTVSTTLNNTLIMNRDASPPLCPCPARQSPVVVVPPRRGSPRAPALDRSSEAALGCHDDLRQGDAGVRGREHPEIVVTRWIASALCVAGSVFAALAMIFDAPFGRPALAGLGFGLGMGICRWRQLGASTRPGCGVVVLQAVALRVVSEFSVGGAWAWGAL